MSPTEVSKKSAKCQSTNNWEVIIITIIFDQTKPEEMGIQSFYNCWDPFL